MDSKLLLCLALSVLLCNIGLVSAACAPCKNSWFKPNLKYIYEYNTEASANFIGINAVPAGGKLTCNVVVYTPCKCHENIKVAMTGCSMSLVDKDGKDEETKTSYKDVLKKFHVEFRLEEGLVKDGEIFSHKEEKPIALNIKRGLVRMLQLKVEKPEHYNSSFRQWDIYGSCPVNYEFSTQKKWTIHTDLDITNCDLHSYFKYQFTPRSHIKNITGGFHITNLTELQYPFQSKFSCDYKLNTSDHIESVSCLQRQDFEVLKHYGNVEATAMFNVSQSLVLKKISKGKSNLKLPADSTRKTALPFEFEDDKTENPPSVSEINELLSKIADAYDDDKLTTMSGYFYNLIKMTRNADEKTLERMFSKFNNCPRSNDQCQVGIAALKEIIYIDVLSNCGKKKCIKAVVKNLDKLTDWKKNVFLLNLNLYSDIDEEILSELLNVCKTGKLNACTTLTNLALTYSKTVNLRQMKQPNNPVYGTLDHYYKLLNQNSHDSNDEIKTIWILKGLENLGPLVQNVYRKIIPEVVKCAESVHHSLAMRKSAIRALKTMDYDSAIEAAMKTLLKDAYDSISVRAEAFLTLEKYEKKEITKFLLGWIQKERIQEMKIFMQTYLKSILQSEDKKMKTRQKIWKEVIDKDSSFEFKEYLRMDSSKYVSFSKTFTLPMLQYPYGGQIEARVVYDPESLMPRNVIISTKAHFGQNNLEIFEINFELEGMEKFLQNIYMSKGMSFWKRLWLFWSKLTETGPDHSQTKDFKFSLPDDDIVDELIKLLDVANFPQEIIPKGYVHVKMYGYNIFMWDVITFLNNLPNLKKNFMEELKTEKLRLGQLTELYRSIPTAFGVPYNMTLLISNIYHTSNEITKPNSRSFKFRMAVNFYARVSLDLPKEIPEGIEMQTEMQVYYGISGRNKAEYNTKPGAAEHFKWTIEVDRADKDIVLLNIKHRLYLVRGDQIHVSADKSPGIKKQSINWCFTPLASILFHVKACFRLTKPDVLNSHDHAYMPLNGDVDMSLTLKPMDKKIEKVQMEIVKEVTSSSKPESIFSIKTAVLSGSSTNEKVTIDVKRSLDGDKLSVTTRFPDMKDITFNLELDKHRTKQIHKVNFEMTLTVLQLKEILGVHFKGTNSNTKTFANLRLTFMEVISDNTFELSEANSKTIWHFNTKYHCPPSYSMLYQLHIDPEKAAKENDVTHVKLYMKRVREKVKKQKWVADRELRFIYPGHDYTYVSHMNEVNNKGMLTGNITWKHDWGKEFLDMTGEMTITNPSPDVRVELFKLVYLHKEDNTSLNVKFKKTTGPLLFAAYYEIDYDKVTGRKKRSTKKLLKKLADMAKRISAGEFRETPKPEIKTRPPPPPLPTPAATFSPGPHRDIFYKIYNFLKNGPKNWITRVSIRLETTPRKSPVSKTIYSTEHKLEVDVNYPQWDGQEKVKADATFGVAQILDGQKKWAEISFKGSRLPKNTDMTFHLIEKENYLNYSHELKSTKVANKFSFEKVDNKEFNLCHKLQVPTVQQNLDINFRKVESGTKNYLKINSKIASDSWKMIKHEYFSEQTWYGTFILTPEYGLDRVSSLYHEYVNYTSHWKLLCNADELTMDLKAFVLAKHMAIISMDGHVTIDFPKNADLPKVMVKLYLPDVNLRFAGRVADEKNLVIQIKKVDSGQNTPVASWTMSLIKPTEISQDITIKPNVVPALRKWTQKKQLLFYEIFGPFVAAFDSEKPYTEIMIPYYGQTVGELLNNVFYSSVRTVMPFFDIVPLSSRPMSEVFYERILKMSQSFKKKYKKSIFDGAIVNFLKSGPLDVLKATGYYIQERVKNYPRLFNLYMERAVKARLMPMLAKGKIHFTLFHPFIWESFKTSPKLTTPLYLLITKIQSRDFFPLLRRYSPHVAILSDDNVVTFDGYLYKLPTAFGSNKCTHLLAADLAHKTFAVLRQNDGVILSCSRTSLKIFNNCSISVDGDSSHIELPYQCPMKMTSAKVWGSYVIVTSIYGVEIMCSSNEMKIIFNGIHHNHTLGLLGNADGDFGTDMKLTDGTLASNTAEFINHYELSKKQKCQITKKDIMQTFPKRCPAETKRKCLEMFTLYISPLKSCFDVNSPVNYLDLCTKSCAGSDEKPNFCSLVSTYVSQCQPKKDINLPESCIKCTQSKEQLSWKEKTRKIKRDVVIIIDEHHPIGKAPALNYVYSLFEQVQIKDARLGLVACGHSGIYEHPNVFTINGRYFGNEDNINLALENLKKATKGHGKDSDKHDDHGHQSHGHYDSHFHKGHRSPLYNPHNSEHFGHQYSHLHEALDWAADYPFKKDSGRMIIIFADIMTLKNTSDLAQTVSMLAKRDIVVNIFTETTKIMNKKFYGVNHQGKVFHKSKKNIEIKLPTDEYFRLIQNTRGVLWNAKLILSQNSGFTSAINNQLDAQMSEKRCRNCKCIYSKERQKSVVHCVADDLSSKC